MRVKKTWIRTGNLQKKYDDRKYKGQSKLIVAALLSAETSQTLDSLVQKLDVQEYWDTVRRKDRNGKRLQNSWFIQKARGVSGSIRYHLNALRKDGLVEVGRE